MLAGSGLVAVIEDDHDIREMLCLLLESAGYEVVSACNGQEAIGRLQHKPPALILLDLMMPVMNGLQFLERRRQHAKLAGCPVVLISGDEQLETRAQAAGVPEFMRKPIDADELLAVVGRYCDPN